MMIIRTLSVFLISASVGLTAPTARAQLAAVDTVGLASAVANALLRRYATPGDYHGPTVIKYKGTVPSPWEAAFETALRRLDATALDSTPTPQTMRTVFTPRLVTADSAVFGIAFTHCATTGRAFGNVIDFVFRRSGTEWTLLRESPNGHGDGRC